MSNTNSAVNASRLLQNYARYEIDFSHGEGVFLYDRNGNKYLDFLCGIAVTSFGHNHPVIKAAVKEQLDKLWHLSNLFYSPLQEELAFKLASQTGHDFVFFSNSGTEANEAAIKFTRKWGEGRYGIISTQKSFHGRTMGAVSASGQEKLWKGFYPLLEGFNYVPFNDLAAMKAAVNENTAAIIIEPIQGEGGVAVATDEYLKGLRALCDENNILLIFDEIQCGIGRTGKLYAHQWAGVVPDILSSAKGIANGLPLGATFCYKPVGEVITPGSHGTTFGGNPVALASALAVVGLLTPEMLSKISDDGDYLMGLLKSLNSEHIIEVRGKGLMIGVEFVKNINPKDVLKKLMERKILSTVAGDTVLRILPPFIAEKEHFDFYAENLDAVLREF